MSARSLGGVLPHSKEAFLAALAALSTSFFSPKGTFAITSSVVGFITSIVLPSIASTHLPSTKFSETTKSLFKDNDISCSFALSESFKCYV